MTAVPARVFVVVSARMASSRCPGKAVVPLAGRPLLAVLLERMAAARNVDGVVLATSNTPTTLLASRSGTHTALVIGKRANAPRPWS